jgi:hypothetical protein
MSKPILIIDNEKGSRFLIPFFKQELPDTKVFVKDTTSLADVLQAMTMLNNGEIDFLFIDSLSKIWYQYVQDYKAKNNTSFMQLNDWGKILPAWQSEFSDKFVNISGSIVFTGRGGNTYEKEEDEKNDAGKVIKKGSFVKSGVKMKMAGDTPFEPDINIWMDQIQEIQDDKKVVWREAMIMKDRSGVIDGMTFKNPTYKDFKPVVDFLDGLPIGDVKGMSDDTNLAPSENWDAKNKRDERDKTISEIEGTFNLMGLGTSKEDKQLKSWLLNKTFNVTTIENLSTVKFEILKSGLPIIQKFANGFIDYIAVCNEEGIKPDGKRVADIFTAALSENQLTL